MRIEVFPLGWDEEGFDNESFILIVLKNGTHRWVSHQGITLEIDQATVLKAVQATPNRDSIQPPTSIASVTALLDSRVYGEATTDFTTWWKS